MADTKMQINKLNYDASRGIVDFSLRKSVGGTAIFIGGEVPLTVINTTALRGAAKAAVRQALLDAADALSDQAREGEADEGIHPEDLNAANDD